MVPLSSSPNISKAFEGFKIMLELNQVKDLEEKGGVIGIAIVKALDNPYNKVIPWLKLQVEHNATMMGEIIGEELALKILNF